MTDLDPNNQVASVIQDDPFVIVKGQHRLRQD